MATPFKPVFEFEDVPPPSSPSAVEFSERDSLPPEHCECAGTPPGSNAPEGDEGNVRNEPQTPVLGQRRRASEAFDVDLSQDAQWASRRVRLRPVDSEALLAISRMSAAQREMWAGAMMLKITEKLDCIAPADAKWAISENLKDKIEQYTNAILCSPVLAEYVSNQSSTKLVAGILARHPSWGYTPEIQADKYRREIVLGRIGQRLTDRRSDIKEVILLSLGPDMQPGGAAKESKKPKIAVKTDIVQLCSDILARCHANDLSVTLQMCGRIALLRKTMVAILQSSGARFEKYWYYVDLQLSTLQSKYPGDTAAISRIIKKALDEDLQLYGRADLPTNTRAARMQEVADSAASGAFDTLDD